MLAALYHPRGSRPNFLKVSSLEIDLNRLVPKLHLCAELQTLEIVGMDDASDNAAQALAMLFTVQPSHLKKIQLSIAFSGPGFKILLEALAKNQHIENIVIDDDEGSIAPEWCQRLGDALAGNEVTQEVELRIRPRDDQREQFVELVGKYPRLTLSILETVVEPADGEAVSDDEEAV